MPQVSESLDKLSKSLEGLSERAKVAEQRVADARSETHEQLEARIAGVKSAAQRRQDEVRARGGKAHDEIASHWSELRDKMHEHLSKVKTEIDERRDDHNAKVARRRADRAEANAVEAIDFALYAIDEAEAAVLNATDAQAIADALD